MHSVSVLGKEPTDLFYIEYSKYTHELNLLLRAANCSETACVMLCLKSNWFGINSSGRIVFIYDHIII